VQSRGSNEQNDLGCDPIAYQICVSEHEDYLAEVDN
jgi:hypothetical protein